MKSKLVISILICLAVFPIATFSQNFEGRLSYRNYQVIEKDTIESSTMNYWIKDHLYKHAGYVVRNPLLDLGTLYANADKMTRTNINSSGQVERIPMNLDWEAPKLIAKPTASVASVLEFECTIWELRNMDTGNLISKLWVTKTIVNPYFDQLVELFEYKNSLFPCPGIAGWIIKREDYRREGKIFITELVKSEKMKLDLAEMLVY